MDPSSLIQENRVATRFVNLLFILFPSNGSAICDVAIVHNVFRKFVIFVYYLKDILLNFMVARGNESA